MQPPPTSLQVAHCPLECVLRGEFTCNREPYHLAYIWACTVISAPISVATIHKSLDENLWINEQMMKTNEFVIRLVDVLEAECWIRKVRVIMTATRALFSRLFFSANTQNAIIGFPWFHSKFPTAILGAHIWYFHEHSTARSGRLGLYRSRVWNARNESETRPSAIPLPPELFLPRFSASALLLRFFRLLSLGFAVDNWAMVGADNLLGEWIEAFIFHQFFLSSPPARAFRLYPNQHHMKQEQAAKLKFLAKSSTSSVLCSSQRFFPSHFRWNKRELFS